MKINYSSTLLVTMNDHYDKIQENTLGSFQKYYQYLKV